LQPLPLEGEGEGEKNEGHASFEAARNHVHSAPPAPGTESEESDQEIPINGGSASVDFGTNPKDTAPPMTAPHARDEGLPPPLIFAPDAPTKSQESYK
jgi:hypothetical protein